MSVVAEEKRTDERHKRRCIGMPLAVGLACAALAIALSLAGLWRENNLTLRNALLGILLGGGTWGLIGWAIATAVLHVQEDLEADAQDDRDAEK